MSTDHYPSTFKEAFITPAIKKPGLNVTNAQSLIFRWCQSYLSGLSHSNSTPIYSPPVFYRLSSLAFRPGHSTETAVLRVLSDLLQAVNSGDVAALVLDLSAAFDTVDHAILCRRLRLSFGLDGSALAWFQSYLHGRSQYVRRGVLSSFSVQLARVVPQGSLLGPILFIIIYLLRHKAAQKHTKHTLCKKKIYTNKSYKKL